MAKRKAARSARGKARKRAKPSKKRSPSRRVAKGRAAKKKLARRSAKPRKRSAAKKAPVKARRAAKAARPVLARKAKSPRRPATLRKPPALDRERVTVQGDDIVPTPPSSLDFDRTASAARTGRRELRERLDRHTETSPAMTAGDVDADWESAYSVGDEAPGGDNPTPDQDVVDDIGKAVGVQYDDNEELKGEAKITKRDKHRWELDPASSEDFNDR